MKRTQSDLTLSSSEDEKPQIRSKQPKPPHSKEKAVGKSVEESWETGKDARGRAGAEKKYQGNRQIPGEPLGSSSNSRRGSVESMDGMDLDEEGLYDANPDSRNSATKSRIHPLASSSRLPPPRQSHHEPHSTPKLNKHTPLPPSTRLWEPTIKETFNRHHPTAPAGLTIPDLLGDKTSLRRVIISSFVLDQDWVLSHFVDDLRIKVLLVQPPDLRARAGRGMKPGEVLVQKGTNWSWLYPKFAGKNKDGKNDKEDGLYHIKFMVLVFETFTRIVVTSGNFMAYDWSDIENSIVVQDFPFLPSSHNPSNAANPTHSEMFSLPLYRLFKRFLIPDSFLGFFGRCDWSGSGGEDGMRLVVSNAGTWSGWEGIEEGGGLSDLARAVESCGFEEGGTWEIEAAGSSIVNYAYCWLTHFHASASGVSPRTHLTPLPPKTLIPKVEPKLPLSILWHSLDYVERSANGPHGGGTLFGCGESDFDMRGEYYVENIGKKGDVLAHTKSILGIRTPPASAFSSKAEGYLYIGSANLTSSGAWGVLTAPSLHSSPPMLQIKNAEMGVLLPVRAKTMEELQERLSAMVGYVRPLSGFEGARSGWHQVEYFREQVRRGKGTGKETGKGEGKKKIPVRR